MNGYYNGVFGQWNVDFNAYLLGKNNSTNEVFNNDDKAAQSENEVRNYLYAMRMVVKRSFRKGTLSFGTEETFTNGTTYLFKVAFLTTPMTYQTVYLFCVCRLFAAFG